MNKAELIKSVMFKRTSSSDNKSTANVSGKKKGWQPKKPGDTFSIRSKTNA
jgi:hypothetical protein